MPVRTLKKSYRGQPSWFQSRKAAREVFCESNLERDFYYLLEFFDWVVTFEEQPLTLPYLDVNEQVHQYTPDTRAHLRLGKSDENWLYEVKYRADLRENWAEYKPKFQGAIYYRRRNGFDRFKIMTEGEIRTAFSVAGTVVVIASTEGSGSVRVSPTNASRR